MHQKYKHSKITLRRLKLGLFIIVVLKLVMDCICCFKAARSAEWDGFLPQRSLNKFGSRQVLQLIVLCLPTSLAQTFPCLRDFHSFERYTLPTFSLFWNFPEIWKYFKLPQFWGSETSPPAALPHFYAPSFSA